MRFGVNPSDASGSFFDKVTQIKKYIPKEFTLIELGKCRSKRSTPSYMISEWVFTFQHETGIKFTIWLTSYQGTLEHAYEIPKRLKKELLWAGVEAL